MTLWTPMIPGCLIDWSYGRSGEPRMRWDVLGMVLLVAAVLSLSGCWLKKGIDAEAHIRPAKKDVPVAPAPPPAPPPDDWAPPWFRRPKPEPNKNPRAEWQEKQEEESRWQFPPYGSPPK